MTLLQQNFVTAKPINFYYLVCKLDRVQYQMQTMEQPDTMACDTLTHLTGDQLLKSADEK